MCPMGFYQDQAGAVSCKAVGCSPGKYGSSTATAASGTTMKGIGATSMTGCIECPIGTYNPSVGAISAAACTRCPKGRWSNTTGVKSFGDCPLCPAGSFGSATGRNTSRCSGECAFIRRWGAPDACCLISFAW